MTCERLVFLSLCFVERFTPVAIISFFVRIVKEQRQDISFHIIDQSYIFLVVVLPLLYISHLDPALFDRIRSG